MTTAQELKDNLDQAIASGVKTISYDGRSITYRDLDELKEVAEIVAVNAADEVRDTRRHLAVFCRGY